MKHAEQFAVPGAVVVGTRAIDPEYKARREAEMRAKIDERLERGELLQWDIQHQDLPRAPKRAAPEGVTRKEGEAEGGAAFADVDEVGRVALSSETPIKRVGWWGEVWIEILDHGDGNIRLQRVEQGLAMLAEHNRTRLAGKWLEGAVDEDRVLRARPMFSRNQFAQEVQGDVLDGVRDTTSIGYRVWNAQLENVDEDGVETWRFDDWEPLEASWEVIPADLSVGVGRSADRGTQPAGAAEGGEVKPTGEGKDLTTAAAAAAVAAAAPPAAPATAPAPATVKVEDIRAAEKKRIHELRSLGQMHGLDDKRIEKWIDDGLEFADAARQVVEEKRAKPPKPATAPARTGDLLGLSEDDKRRYSVRAAILQTLPKDFGGMEPGFETEISRALEKFVPSEYKSRGGLFLPSGILDRAGSLDEEALARLAPLLGNRQKVREMREMITRAGLDTGTSTKGAEAVFTEYGGFIELLRSRTMVMQLGATFLPGLQGNVSFLRQTAAAIAEWVAEAPGSDQSDTELALDLVTLSPNTLMASTFFSRQLLRQAVVAVDAMVEMDLVALHARAIDRGSLHGAGTATEPEGIYNATGVNPVAFGGTVTFPKVVEMETAIAEADADIEGLAYLTTPGVRGVAKTTLTFPGATAAAGGPIWTGGVRNGEMNGYRAAASTQVRTDLGPTPTPTPIDRHGMVFGAWPQVLIGEWGILEIITDPYSKKKQGLIEVSSFQMADIALRHPEAFSKATGLDIS